MTGGEGGTVPVSPWSDPVIPSGPPCGRPSQHATGMSLVEPVGTFNHPFRQTQTAPTGPLGLAEGVGFEPTVGLHLRLISSQVHSTTLPPLRSAQFYQLIDPLLSAIRVSPSFGDKLLPVPKPETGYSDRNDIYPQILARAFFKGMRACCPGHAGKLRQFRVACPALRLDP